MWINDLYVSFSSDFKLNQMPSRTWSIPALTLEKTLKLQLKWYTQFCILKHNGGEQTLQLDILRIIKSNDEQQQWHSSTYYTFPKCITEKVSIFSS